MPSSSLGRKHVLYFPSLITPPKKKQRIECEEAEQKKRDLAALKIQSAQRGRVARREYKTKKEQAKKESESDEEYELVLATEVDYFRLFPIQPISV